MLVSFNPKYLRIAGALLFSAVTSCADSFNATYSGTLGNSASIFKQQFALTSASQLLLTTTSYGGGANANGTTSAAGGFQPSLTLYTGAGTYVASQQISSPLARRDPVTGRTLDSYLLLSSLQAGGYIVTLTNWATQQPPTATNLSDGFINYGGATFADVGAADRNGAYALNVVASDGSPAVPEPGSVLLTSAGAMLLLFAGLRKQLNDQVCK